MRYVKPVPTYERRPNSSTRLDRVPQKKMPCPAHHRANAANCTSGCLMAMPVRVCARRQNSSTRCGPWSQNTNRWSTRPRVDACWAARQIGFVSFQYGSVKVRIAGYSRGMSSHTHTRYNSGIKIQYQDLFDHFQAQLAQSMPFLRQVAPRRHFLESKSNSKSAFI